MAELADALASGASVRKDVWVQVPPSAPRKARIYELFFFCPMTVVTVTADFRSTTYGSASA